MNAIEINALTRSFPDFDLGPLDLTLPAGCILGLIGENGAGKSTTMKLLLGALRKDGGSIRVLGRDAGELDKNDIGVVFDEPGLPDPFDLRQLDAIMSGIFTRWDSGRFSALRQQFRLPEDKKFRDLSKGMKMKTAIAVALSHQAKLLILDEPTSGLDPVVRDEVVELLAEFTREEDHSVLISSHIVSDLEKLCDYVAFLHEGKLLLCEEKDLLLSGYGIAHGTAEQLDRENPAAIRHRKDTPYGCEALVLRDRVSPALSVSPVNLEDLFLYMVKEAAK